MKRRSTILAALGLGVAIAWMTTPYLRDRSAVAAVGSSDSSARESAWRRLTTDDRNGRPRAARWIDEINEQLSEAPPEALERAGSELRRAGLWGWDIQSSDLVLREIEARTMSPNDDDRSLALSSMQSCPREAPIARVSTILDRLLSLDDPLMRREALEAALRWVQLDRVDLLAGLAIGDDPEARRVVALAYGWSEASLPDELERPDPDPSVMEARMLTLARRTADGARFVAMMHVAEDRIPDESRAHILRRNRTPQARVELERLAEAGDRNAAFVLQAEDPIAEADAARRVLGDSAEPVWRRRLAAWRLPEVDEAAVRDILDVDPADESGHVYAAALLAERSMRRDAARSLAEKWITDYNDDRKRAGALLAALLGGPSELLREAYDAEDTPEVRTFQRLALMALGTPVGDEAPDEFAHRTLHTKSGDVDPDALMCLLLTGRIAALRFLTGEPSGDWRRSVEQREWLIRRFAPRWHERAGRPVGSNARVMRLHFDSLNVLRLLTERHLSYDAETRTFSTDRP